jgi:ELKS/RAB6-interacting/CAST family protein 1
LIFLRILKAFQNEYVQELENQNKSYEDVQASSQISQQEIEILQREKDKQNKEILILKKTVDEMELRIETQKQTLCARDESMRKL